MQPYGVAFCITRLYTLSQYNNMRKITQEAIRAFSKGKNFKKSNTEVKVLGRVHGKPNRIELLLHGNVIAYQNWRYLENTEPSSFSDRMMLKQLWITSAGWPTNTTKERLNALNGVNIYQKDFQWYLNGEAWNGTNKFISGWTDYF